MSSYNFSILAIPAYHFISVLPHTVAVFYATNGQPSKWDNCNPRSETTKSAVAKRLDAKAYATYERLEAAHANSMENMPIFIAAVVLGNVAGLHKVEGFGGMTWFTAAFLLARIALNIVYVIADTQPKSYIRSSLYNVGLILCWTTLFRAAARLV